MRDRSSTSSPIAILEAAAEWAPRIIVLSLVVIVVSTLYPFKFILSEPSALLISKTSRLDFAANVVLFAPLGFGLASAFAQRKYSPAIKLLAVLLLGGSLSLLIEILQTFLPGRHSSLWDVFTNTVGAGVGYGLFVCGGKLFYQWVPPIFSWLHRLFNRLTLKHLIISIIGYLVLATILVLSWQKISLHGWDVHQPLSVGGKVTVQMPEFLVPEGKEMQTVAWNGTVSNLLISDRTLNNDEIEKLLANPNANSQNRPSVLALYPLKGKQALQDKTGQSPKLVWQGNSSASSTQAGANLSAAHWLTTNVPISSTNQRIQDRGQFTLSATLAAADLDSRYFVHPPILAIGPLPTAPIPFDKLWRNSNVVLSQVGAELVLRMKLSRTGWDRQAYTARIPDVFLDTKPHRVSISYAGFVVRVEIDGTERSLIFDATPNRYQIVFYVLMLMPLALLLSLVGNRLQHRLAYMVLVAGGTIGPSLALESLLVSEASRPMRAANLLLGFLIMGGMLLACRGNSSMVRGARREGGV